MELRKGKSAKEMDKDEKESAPTDAFIFNEPPITANKITFINSDFVNLRQISKNISIHITTTTPRPNAGRL
jgi:hypothetical protein